jgi:hypothetical protein
MHLRGPYYKELVENVRVLRSRREEEVQVEADAVAATAEGLRDKVKAAQDVLASRWAGLQALQADVATAERDACAAEKQASIQAEAVQSARAQLALRESLLAEKDSLIESLQRQLGLVRPPPFGQAVCCVPWQSEIGVIGK